MKRIFCALLAALMLSSCGTPDFSSENKLAGYDADMSGAIRADGGYYYLSSSPRSDMYIKTYICYYDSETGYSGIVCARPECLHQDESCSAYFPAGAEALSYYNGKLWWYDSGGIYSCDPDLRNRRKVVSTPSVERFESAVFHRGYMYLWGSSKSVENAELGENWSFGRISLKNGEYECLFEDTTAPVTAARGISSVAFSGPRAYIAFDRSNLSYDGSEWQTDYDFDIVDIDLVSGMSEIICTDSEFQPFEIYSEDGEIWVSFNKYVSGSECSAGVAKLTDGGFEEIFSYSVDNALSFYEAPVLSGGAAITYNTDGGISLCVRDLNGDLMFEGKPNAPVEYSDDTFVDSVGCDGEYVYLSTYEVGTNFSEKLAALPLDGSEGFVIKG